MFETSAPIYFFYSYLTGEFVLIKIKKYLKYAFFSLVYDLMLRISAGTHAYRVDTQTDVHKVQ